MGENSNIFRGKLIGQQSTRHHLHSQKTDLHRFRPLQTDGRTLNLINLHETNRRCRQPKSREDFTLHPNFWSKKATLTKKKEATLEGIE